MKERFGLCRCTMFVAALTATGLFAGAVRPAGEARRAPLQLEISADPGPVQWPMRIEDYVNADEAQLQAAPPDKARVYIDAAGRYSVLVHIDPNAKVRGIAAPGLARAEVRNFAAARALNVHYEYDVLPNTLNLRGLTQQDITALKNLPGVVRVEMDELKHIYLHDSVPLINGLQSQITAAGLSARAGGVRLCVIDTGIRADHAMFVGKVDSAAGWDFYNNDSNPADDNGHGTNVSGIAAGLDGLTVNFGTCGNEPFQGVAVDATIIPVKVCSGSGSCPTSDIVAGINHCADVNLANGQADVISMSLGGGQYSGTCDGDASASAANNAVAAGVTVVAASGNNGFSNAMGSPACGSNVISVGAVYDTNFPNCQDSRSGFTWCLDSFCFNTCTDDPVAADDLVCFSNRSDNLDVTAPGCDIWSATNSGGTTSISSMCGTSQATPHVAGVAALILGQNPALTPAEVRQILRDSAVDLGSPGFDRSYGYGRVDVISALNMAGGGGGCQTNAECDDGVFCNGAETCSGGTCQSGTAPTCNDGVACTDDSCNAGTDSCDNIANDANCDDGLACNGVETCDAVNDCQAGTAVNCDDGVACTTDACNEPGGTCSSTPNDAACDNGLFCDGAETCDTVNDCQAGTAVNCNDGVACTDDSCNEGTNSCDNVANNANCDNGLFCDGAETCDAVNDCQAGADPCPGQSCDEATNTCTNCLVNADCDDGLYCNGAETCVGGVCQAGTAVNCDDGVACTDDSCNEGTNSCDNVANNANCDNGLFCDGTETCDAVNDCQAGTAVNCNDGVACTDDSCNEGTNSCDNVANNANCDNGVFCDGTETCDPVNDCQAGTPPTCDDGVACTDDSCNAGTDSCDNVANDANCPDDGLFCTGTEFCDAAADCSSTGNPCLAGETCNEATNACDAGVPAGEGYVLSKNADFSTDDRTFFRTDTIYMKVWTDQVNFNDIKKLEWELKDANKKRVKQPLTNHFDNTYTASFALSGLPSTAIDWTWKGKVEDNGGTKYNPTDAITVLDAPACTINSDCDDADACTTDVCSGGSCSNTPINCDDGNACTADSCDAGTGLCNNTPISCDDGDACTTDSCDVGTGCSNTPINCDDGDPCTSDSCSGGVCFNDPLPTCCGDGFCDAGEDSCNCPSDCGAPPATETNCTDGIDDDCDGKTDCADADCSADPACSTPTGEGYILSKNPDFSTDDRTFNRSDTIYMKVWSDQVDFNDINRARWELKDPNKKKVRQPMTNHFDGTYTAAYDLANLPSSSIDWTWKGEVKDNAGNRYKPSDVITVLP